MAARIVYSTDPNRKLDPENDSQPDQKSTYIVYIERERKGRGGKTVTTISNLRGDLKPLLKELRILCGSGGTIKDGIIEIQGDQREKIGRYLEKKGVQFKKRGG